MRKVFVVAIVSLFSFVTQADVLESCQYKLEIDAEQTTVVDIVVEDGKGGGIAIGLVKFDGELKIVTDDINQKTYSADQKKELFSESMLGSIAASLNLDLKNLDHAVVTNIDAEKNADDASGASVIKVYNSENQVLFKVAQAGWSYGLCL